MAIKSFFSMIISAYSAGILVSFTPCIYPIIPITISVIQAQASQSAWFNFLLSVFYVLGIAVVFAALGYLVASTSLIFGQWFASPFFIVFVIAFFLYFAFAMFGFYELHIPSFLRSRTMPQAQGSLVSSFILGVISGTVTSPCLTPALALMLGYVAKIGNPIAGFLTLFAFSFGMGTLLILIGTFSGMMHYLPQAGSWMIEVKKIFGIILLGVCIYLLQPLLSTSFEWTLYGILLLGASCYYFFTSKALLDKLIRS